MLNIVEFKFLVDSFRVYATYSEYKNENTKQIPPIKEHLNFFLQVLKIFSRFEEKNVFQTCPEKDSKKIKHFENLMSPTKYDWSDIEHVTTHRTYNQT